MEIVCETYDLIRRHYVDEKSDAELAGAQDSILKTLEKDLPLIRARGWATDVETEDGIIAIGAPIFDAAGAVFGATGVIVPTFRFDKSTEMYMDAVQRAAADATRLLKDAEQA